MTWPVVRTNKDVEAHIDLMVAKGKPPAFGIISINCSIPEDSFHKRFIEVQVCSVTWSEEDVPSVGIHDIQSLIREEYKRRGKNAPIIALSNVYSFDERTKNIVVNTGVEVRFRSKVFEIDLKKEEEVDEQYIANLLFEDLVSLRRIYERLSIKS